MQVLAQQGGGESPSPGLFHNEVLDEFKIPAGEWADQAVAWIAVRLDWLFRIVEWPFDRLIGLLVGDTLEAVSWVWVVVAFFVVGALARNIRVGIFAGVAIAACGFLGDDLWQPTIETVGYVVVAVLLCVIVGVPVGVACGRLDAVWRTVRPVLDAMQAVHAFTYLLAFLYFFGIGVVPATIVTMVFALPPVVRLTSMGVRQAPADVVEASRARGVPEWRVLVSAQLPLARPAILAGVNQSLLLAMPMLAIAAIAGAGGLGAVMFQALATQDLSKGMAGGLAYYLVAAVFDRISRPAGADPGSLLRRVRLAWAHRRDPETLLSAGDRAPPAAGGQALHVGFAPLAAAERAPMLVAAAGGLAAVVSVFLTWSNGAGFLSAYGRSVDEHRPGESFSGLSASGGSWFGILALALGLFVAASVVTVLASPGRGPRWLTADGAVIASLALLVMMIAYILASPSDLAQGQSTGVGPWTALLGAFVASAGSLWWIRSAHHAPARPLGARIRWGCVIGSGAAGIIIGVGAISAWSFDERAIAVITPEVQAQIDELTSRAEANPDEADTIAAQITAILAQRRPDPRIVIDGISSDGAGLGIWVFLAGLAGLVAALPAAGVFGRDENRQWQWSSVIAGIGAGCACVGLGWILTHVRSADDNYISGVGSFLAVIGGLALAATAASVLKEFRRPKVHADTEPACTQ